MLLASVITCTFLCAFAVLLITINYMVCCVAHFCRNLNQAADAECEYWSRDDVQTPSPSKHFKGEELPQYGAERFT